MVLNEMLRERERFGKRTRSIAQVRAFRKEFQPEQLARFVFITPDELDSILNTMDAHPDWDDEKIAETVDFE